jgi:hypothetical protein
MNDYDRMKGILINAADLLNKKDNIPVMPKLNYTVILRSLNLQIENLNAKK